MKNRSWAVLVSTAITVLFVLGACGAPSTSGGFAHATADAIPSAPAGVTPVPVATPTVPVNLTIADSRYGKVLVNGSGRVLYLFSADRGGVSSCYTACATAWPPFLVTQAPPAGPALNGALASTTMRNDGTQQATYNGHPLYFYVGDRSPGEIKCQAVVEFGGGWYVVDGQGNEIRTP